MPSPWLRSSADKPDQPRSADDASSPSEPYFCTQYSCTVISFSWGLTLRFLQTMKDKVFQMGAEKGDRSPILAPDIIRAAHSAMTMVGALVENSLLMQRVE
jgi:hypothetical protein